MPVGPIDILRSQEASQIKHMESQRAQYAQGQLSKNFQNMIQQEHHKPNETTKAENHEFRYDAKEKGSNQYYGPNGKKKEKKEEKKESKSQKKPLEPTKGKGFDILI